MVIKATDLVRMLSDFVSKEEFRIEKWVALVSTIEHEEMHFIYNLSMLSAMFTNRY